MKILSIFLVGVTAWVVAEVPSVHAQGLEGYFYGPRAPLPVTLLEGDDSGRFRLSIERQADSEWERELLERAETLYPEPELIADSVAAHLANPRNRIGTWGQRFEEAAAASGPRWWWLLHGDLGLPFALTGQAVLQYLDHYRELRDGPNPYAEYNPGIEHSAELVYAARVRRTAGGYVVELSLSWSFYCGSLCGLWLQHARRVEFDEDGTVVRVQGDRAPSYKVS